MSVDEPNAGQGNSGKSSLPINSDTSVDPAGTTESTDVAPSPLQLAVDQFKRAWATVSTCSTCEVALPALRHAANAGLSLKDMLSEQKAPASLTDGLADVIDRIHQKIENVQARLDLANEIDRHIEEIRADIDADINTQIQ